MAKNKIEYKIDNNKKFVNPYNFVSVMFNRKSEGDLEELKDKEKLYTGKMKCTIHVKTPIIIPDIETEENENEHKKYKFMKDTEGNYMIPASSIRGVVRNVFETATDSCFSTLKDDMRITIRSSNPFKPGILIKENEKWHLYEAKRYKLKKEVGDDDVGKYIKIGEKKIYSGSSIKVSILHNNLKVVGESTENNQEYFLVLGEAFSNKKNESVFKIGKDLMISQEIINKAKEGLETTLEIYRNPSINKNYGDSHRGYKDYERMEKNGCTPVWYQYDDSNRRLYLSMAAIGRKTFVNTLNNIIKVKKPCKSKKNLCEACMLFGMTGEKEEALGSRIRFTDAKAINDINTEMRTLSELGSPKMSYMPFYGKIFRIDDLIRDYDSGLEIRGRKFYWHSDTWQENNAEGNKRNATMELVKEKAKFSFDIFFEGITKKELNKLIWSLNFWENKDNGSLMHKIGHGKPLGFGSVKITVDEILERKYNLQNGYELNEILVDYNSEMPINKTNDSVKDLLFICNYKNRKNVNYPYIVKSEEIDFEENDVASHKWFTENKKELSNDIKNYKKFIKNKKTSNKPTPKGQFLRKLTDDNQQLSAYKIVQR